MNKPMSHFFLLTVLLLLISVFVTKESAFAEDAPLAKVLQPFVDNHTLAGAVALVATKDKVLDVESVGWMDIAAQKPMRNDAVFWIASQSKPITAAALMILVDEGKINLDDAVEKYLPEFRGQMVIAEQDDTHRLLKKPVHPITVGNILSHTSGLPFASPLETPTLDLYPLEVRVRSYAMAPLQFEPDSKYQYSNAGINTAGRIIEVVSEIPYEEFLNKRLFEPLRLKDTTFWPNDEQIARIAHSYKPGPNNTGLEAINIGQLRYPLNDKAHRFPMPAGGLFSTAADMARFCQMIMNGGALEGKRYLSENAVKTMTSKQTGALPDGYGLGWSTGGPGPDWFGHGGAYSTNMTIDAKSGLIFIWMVQHAGFPGEGGKSQEAFKQAAIALAK